MGYHPVPYVTSDGILIHPRWEFRDDRESFDYWWASRKACTLRMAIPITGGFTFRVRRIDRTTGHTVEMWYHTQPNDHLTTRPDWRLFVARVLRELRAALRNKVTA